VDAVGAEISQPFDRGHGVEDGPGRLAERIAPAVADGPQAEGELVRRFWFQSAHVSDPTQRSATSSVAVNVVAELVPAMISKRPGSTTRRIRRSISGLPGRAAAPSGLKLPSGLWMALLRFQDPWSCATFS